MPSYQRKSSPRGLTFWDSLMGFFGMLVVAGSIGVWVAVSTAGAELLHMPSWAWVFAAVAGFSAICATRFGMAMGAAEQALAALKAFGLLALGGWGVFFLYGFFRTPVPGEPGTIGELTEVIPQLSRGIAWAALVGIPGAASITLVSIGTGAWLKRRTR